MTTIRPLRPEEAEAYVALRREMLLDSPWAFGASPGADRGSDVAAVRASLARGPGEPEYAIVGALEGERLLAAAGVLREEKAKRAHIAFVWGVYVTPAARGRGLGRAVVMGVLGAARGWPGIASVRLSVSENAPAARALYESLGFVEWGREPDALRVDGASWAERYMWRAV